MEKQEFIKERRKIFLKNNSIDLQKEKLKFIKKLLVNNWNPRINVLEMHQFEKEVIKTPLIIPQYIHECFFCNTREKTLTETRAEIDFLPENKAVEIICMICKELMKSRYHFAIFYAAGQRSPHIIIYDFEQLQDLKPHQREKAQLEFWRSIVPFHFHYLDKSIWSDKHYVPLEFTPHWKYGSPFKLLFEWLPKRRKENAKIWKRNN